MITIHKKSKNIKKIAPRHARHTGELLRLKRIQGQIAGVENMILNERYCPDIILQVKAVTSALKSLELSILEGHIRHCLAKTLAKGSKKEVQKKIDEIILVLDRRGF